MLCNESVPQPPRLEERAGGDEINRYILSRLSLTLNREAVAFRELYEATRANGGFLVTGRITNVARHAPWSRALPIDAQTHYGICAIPGTK